MTESNKKPKTPKVPKPKYAEIRLPYFKQGDDLDACTVKNADGSVNAKETLDNHIKLLEATIEILKGINQNIPPVNNVSLEGNTHHIGITGDDRIINALIEKELAYEDPFPEDEDYTESSEINESDESDGEHAVESTGESNGEQNDKK